MCNRCLLGRIFILECCRKTELCMDSCPAHARMAGGFLMADGDTGGLLLFTASLAFFKSYWSSEEMGFKS